VPTERPLAAAWLVDKPEGPTSHDVVRDIRRRLPRGTKVGHAGTLDPFATGLLVILAGRATRLADRISGRSKRYRAVVRLGWRSVTGDPEGPLTIGGPVPEPDAIRSAVAALAATETQRVPLYSAVRVDGQRLYEHARRGESVPTPERQIRIGRLEIVALDAAAGTVELDLEVSKGTYVRQLAVDLGERLGCGAYCLALRRTGVGALDIVDAVPPEAVPDAAPVPLTSLLTDMPTVVLGPDDVRSLAHGRTVACAGAPGEVAALAPDGRLVAIGATDGTTLRPVSVFTDPEAE
jgi:tRNA pseudouridine55 synthase